MYFGPKTFIADNPLEIFQLFFSDEMLDGIVDASNEYATVTIPAEKFRKWEKYTLNDLKAYLGFQTLMSINRLPSYTDYWSKNPNMRYGPVADCISIHIPLPAFSCGHLSITHNTPSIQLWLPLHHTPHSQRTTVVTSPSHTTLPAYNCGHLSITHYTPSVQLWLPLHHTLHSQHTTVVTSPSHTTLPAYSCGCLSITHYTPSVQQWSPFHHTQHSQRTTVVTSPSHTTLPAYSSGYLSITH